MSSITVKGILIDWLQSHGYDGLCNYECGCELPDLMPCDEIDMRDCKAGYRVACTDCQLRGTDECMQQETWPSAHCIMESKQEANDATH